MTKQLFCALALTSAGYAQTWVSATGSDAASCTRTAPCRTFAHAVTVTPVWGQVSVADPGDYGSVTITQSVTIDGGNMASSVATSGTAITVQAGSGVVQLRNLSVHGNGASVGINFVSGAQLLIENVKVNGFGNWCINADPAGTGNSDLVIKDTSIDNCSSGGIVILGNGNISAKIINTHVNYANTGLEVINGSVNVTGSTFASPALGGSGVGIITATSTSGTPPLVMVDNCQISGWGVGILVNSGGIVQVSRSTISYNNYALGTISAQLISNGNNAFLNNTTMGSFTKTVPLM